MPPAVAISIDSARNWKRISFRLAPTAILMPISRVRSVTVTSMMFMMPIPLMTSEIAPIRNRIRVSAVAILPAAFRISARFSTR